MTESCRASPDPLEVDEASRLSLVAIRSSEATRRRRR